MPIDIDLSASYEEIVKQRRSVRGFLDKPVRKETILRAFELARLSPSNSNVQPWRVFVASGETRNIIRETLVDLASSGVEPKLDFEYIERYPEPYRTRQVETAVALYKELGIARDDKEGRVKAFLRNFELFDAPHIAFLCMDQSFPTSVAVDIGMFAQTLMLAFTSMGIGSCALGSMRNFAWVPREVFGYEDQIGVLFGIAFGYEDLEADANRVRTDRAPLEETVQFKD